MIHFNDPFLQAQYERLKAEPCFPTGTEWSRPGHTFRSKKVRVHWWSRKSEIHWRCTECRLDEPRAKAVCRASCAGMCTYPNCMGLG
jgi:hypothetical protein